MRYSSKISKKGKRDVAHLFLLTLGHLIHIATPILRRYGLWGLVVVLFAENLGFLFAPGEAVVVTAGFLAGKGVLGIESVIPLAILAATAGGYAAYGLGVRYGHAGLLRYGKYVWITPAIVEKTHDLLRRFGVPILLTGRFIVPLRQLQGYLAGTAEIGFRPYALWSAVGAGLWVATWGGGAWWLASSIPA